MDEIGKGKETDRAGRGAEDDDDDDDDDGEGEGEGEGEGTDDDDDDDEGEGEEDEEAGRRRETDDEGEEDASRLTLAFPGREDGDEDFELPLDREALKKAGIKEKVLLERFAQLKRGYRRGQVVAKERREIDTERSAMAQVLNELDNHPIEFMTDRVDGKHHVGIVESLLARMDDDTFEKVRAKVEEWGGDASARRIARADAKEAAADRRDRRVAEERKAATRQRYLNEMREAVESLIPEDMKEDEVAEFLDFVGFKLQQWSKSQEPGTRLNPADVPKLLKRLGVLEMYGLKLPKPGAKPRTRSARAGDDTPSARRGRRRDGDLEERAARAGREFRSRRDRRRAAAATPAGAGAGAAAGSRPPKGQTWKDRLAWLEKKFVGKGK